jgi:hypothetical protein
VVRSPLLRQMPAVLLIDKTGVGDAALDSFTHARIGVAAITIHGSSEVRLQGAKAGYHHSNPDSLAERSLARSKGAPRGQDLAERALELSGEGQPPRPPTTLMSTGEKATTMTWCSRCRWERGFGSGGTPTPTLRLPGGSGGPLTALIISIDPFRCAHNPVNAGSTDQRDDCYDRLAAGRLATVLVLEKGKPAASLRHKATGLSREEAAVPPKGNC